MILRHVLSKLRTFTAYKRCYTIQIESIIDNAQYQPLKEDAIEDSSSKAQVLKTKKSAFQPIKLNKQDAKKYYTLLKMAEYSLSLPEDYKLKKSLALWTRKTSGQQELIKIGFENILNEILIKKNHLNELDKTKESVTLNDPIDSNFNVSLNETNENNNSVKKDINEVYKTPKYRYNLTSGTTSIKFPLTTKKIKRFYKFQELTKLNFKNLSAAEFTKTLNQLDTSWRSINSIKRNNLKDQYENLLLSGKDLNDDLTGVVSIKEKFTQISYEPEPGTSKTNTIRKVPRLKFIINEMTGITYVYGLTYFHVWNYYLGREINKSKLESSDEEINLNKLIKQCESNWIKMSQKEKSQVFQEYESLLMSGKDMLNGHITTIPEKLKIIKNKKTYDSIHVRGTTSDFDTNFTIENHQKDLVLSEAPSKLTIDQPPNLRFSKNQMVGNITIIGELNLIHGYNYFIYENLQTEKNDHLNIKSTLNNLNTKWKSMNEDEQNEYVTKYKQLLESGNDIYLGDQISLAQKSQKQGIKNLVTEIWGQLPPSSATTGLKSTIVPPSIIVDSTTNSVQLVDNLKEVHVFNYFLAKRFPKENNMLELQTQWIYMTTEEKDDLQEEYKNLLMSGQDYLYGKIVSVNEKQPYINNLKILNGIGTKKYQQLIKLENPKSEQDDEELFEYYKQIRKEQEKLDVNDKNVIKKLKQEWDLLGANEKDEIKSTLSLYNSFLRK
ncbi:hypothetical protein KGF54_000572 [Candida jiufengensis]|uniref:uncharacterized protein n=1 Tax=Candida jiufengensis TaxID=497108 RepID=UPI002224F2AA|nr:uncharacterized protein KGF54_000572 [Candida jiufengensis]KAI5956953.1 hypothetical protein KGF54_000572 [Candida jiufengensis]